MYMKLSDKIKEALKPLDRAVKAVGGVDDMNFKSRDKSNDKKDVGNLMPKDISKKVSSDPRYTKGRLEDQTVIKKFRNNIYIDHKTKKVTIKGSINQTDMFDIMVHAKGRGYTIIKK